MNNLEKKKFFDVFPALKLNDNLQAMFEEVYVTRVSSNMSHDKLRVYIESSRLIEKSAIFTVRDEIIRNLRMGKRIGIEIVEKYHLSQQYTVENLLDAYKESIVMELGVRSPIVSTMFKKAPIRWDGNKMIIDLEANIISESRMKILKDTVERIFANRFEMPIEVVIDKKRFETNRFAKQNARRLQNEVEVLLNRDNGPKAKKEEKKEVKAVVNSGPTVITPKKQVTVEPAQAAEKASEGVVKDAQVIEVPQVKKPAALVPAQKSQQQEYKTIAPEQLSADAIQTGAGKLVIVIGQEPFNMTMMTANSGGSLGKVNGKPVVFSILSPDQPYEQMEKAESNSIRFYPTGQTEPTVILECKKLPSPATMEGMPRTYVGEILKAMVK